MPNWCYNKVTCSGTVDDLTQFIEYVQENDNNFSFNAVIPMPEELREVASPVKTFKTKAEVDAYNTQQPAPGFEIGKAITHAKHTALLKKYGHAEWYNWSIKNWGCKWDTQPNEIEMETRLDDRDNGYVSYTFDTPWGPPEEVYRALYDMFPKVHISWFYDEPGMEFSGYLPD